MSKIILESYEEDYEDWTLDELISIVVKQYRKGIPVSITEMKEVKEFFENKFKLDNDENNTRCKSRG